MSEIRANNVVSETGLGAVGFSSGLTVGTGGTITSTGAAVFSGIVTATSFSGSGANITGIPTTGDINLLTANIAVLGFKVAVNGSLAKYNLVDQVIDEFSDATGIDASASTNELLTGGYYVGATTGSNYPTGGTVTTHGSYRVHSFTNTGNTNFVVNIAGTVDILAVGGGGGGGRGKNGSGGGAGGMVVVAGASVSGQTYAVTVGDGAAGGPTSSSNGSTVGSGENTYFTPAISGVAVAVGGGGGVNNARDSSGAGGNGGSGGAGGAPGGAAGTATAGQGNAGGSGGCGTGGASGGGGAGGAGACTAGGVGLVNNYRTGSNVTYAAGGSGGEDNNRSNVETAPGGKGVGTTSSVNADGSDQAGADNTGSGGGGGGESGGNAGGPGGSGIVVIRYATSEFQSSEGNQLTLQSVASTASSKPTKADLVLLIENSEGAATLNTDIKGSISRNNGGNWTQGTLVDEGTWGTNKKIVSFHNLDIDAQPDGTAMKYKIETLNQSGTGTKKITRIHAASIGWK